MNTSNKTKMIVVSAAFAALCCIATMLIRIQSVYGYVNIGDVFVLICGWWLGKKYGAFAAGIGCALADLLAGFPMYIPATFVIKGVMAIIAFLLYKLIKKVHASGVLSRLISAIIAEAWMVFGYFAYESLVLGYGFGAVASVGTNIMQGIISLIPAVIIAEILSGKKIEWR